MASFARVAFAGLDRSQAELVAAARDALKLAYAPYSGVRVGAALRLLDGQLICAANIENAAYGSTLCAERAALAAAYAQGARDFTALAVVIGLGERRNDMIGAPCGACRQMMYEAAQVSSRPIQVILSDPAGESFVVTDMDALLPLAFGPRHLK